MERFIPIPKGRIRELVFNYRKYRPLLQIAFWLSLFGLESLILAGIYDTKMVLLRNGGNTLLQMAVVYFNAFYLLPSFLQKRKIPYFLSLALCLMVVVPLRAWLDAEFTGGILAGLPIYSVAHFLVILTIFGIILWVTTSLQFIENWFGEQQMEKELEAHKLEAELKYLKMQVNPHFLFNALNNIYALSFTGSDQAPSMIMKLSGMMRYLLDASPRDKVPLTNEIEFLRDYIALQNLKRPSGKVVDLQLEGNPEGVMVEPILMLPFLETAVKHGNATADANGWIQAKLTIIPEKLTFSVQNSLPASPQPKDKESGIGLQNIKERLELLYPGKYALIIDHQPTTFSVTLTLDLE